MNQLVKHEAMRQAIVDCKMIDELKLILDQAELYKAAHRIANDKEMLADVTVIIERAKLRLGQIIAAQRETVGLNKGGGDHRVRPAPGGLPTLAEAGIGKRLAHQARTLAAMPEAKFEEHIAETHRAVLSTIGKTMRQEIRKSDREQKEVDLARKARSLPDERFVLVVTDPPHREEPYSRDTGLNKAADNHYPTLTPEEIAKLKPRLFTDAIVICWTTASMMRESMGILEGWGLTYKSHLIWVKERQGKRMGLGRWTRVDHEIALIYTQGRPPAPADDNKLRSVLYAPVGKHSEKPAEFFDMLDSNYPNVPKLEMYARKPRPGWTVWGNEVGD